eukprot:scaffold49769_cov19-Tisochrysis_lutea.AAC.3
MGHKPKSIQGSVKLKRGSQPQEEEEGALPTVAPHLLSAYGERFMSMFDDYDEEAQRQRHQSSKTAGSTCTEQQRQSCKREGLPAHGSREDTGGAPLASNGTERRDGAGEV